MQLPIKMHSYSPECFLAKHLKLRGSLHLWRRVKISAAMKGLMVAIAFAVKVMQFLNA